MMQNPEDSSITVVETHAEDYADTNSNEKNLGTQYIYTTEGQLIPTSAEHISASMDLNAQHYNTVHVTETQDMHIEQIDYQFQQHYSSSGIQEAVPASDSSFTVENPQESYITQPEVIVPQSTNNEEHDQEFVESNSDLSGNIDENTASTPNDSKEITSMENSEEIGTMEDEQNITESDEKNGLDKNSSNSEDKENQSHIEYVQIDSTKEEEVLVPTSDTPQAHHPPENPPKEQIEICDETMPEVQEEYTTSLEVTELVEETLDQTQITNAEDNGTDSVEMQEETIIIEESISQEPGSEDQTYLSELKNEIDSGNSTSSNDPGPTIRQRGRKQKTDVPLHILGHDVNNPMENIQNGKTPKPRLGVKVPYRHLTSQIVTKEEIEKEIVERGRKKQEEKKEELMFARQLTSRLAKKIAPESLQKSKPISKKGGSAPSEDEVMAQGHVEETANDNKKETIDNNSDLLAILEGDGDTEDLTVLSKETEDKAKQSTPTDETNLKNLEREIALQQLQDLPYLSPSTRFVKGRSAKPFLKELPASLSEGKLTIASKPYSTKEKTPVKHILYKKPPLPTDKKSNEMEPGIKVNTTLKTYSRKRKSSDSVTEAISALPSKKTVVCPAADIDLKPNSSTSNSGDVYITKSSRVIKKKVIWDPDENIPSRLVSNKTTIVKVESPSVPKTPAKTVQSKSENKSVDLPKKVPIDTKVKPEKKAEEKSPLKKTPVSPADKRPSPGSKAVVKPKKLRSEVDKLLGDEGAIKMLYELKTSEDQIEEKKKKTVISVERTFKELAKKANQIKSDLVNTSTVESPKSLRKKDAIVSPVSTLAVTKVSQSSDSPSIVPSGISRQKSKDSSRSSPPPSPTFSFPNETSYLIRRRSSSSISSSADTADSVELDDIEDRTTSKKSANISSSDSLKVKKSKGNSLDSEKSQKRAENRIGHYKSFSFKKSSKSIIIDLHSQDNSECYFTLELLEELTTILNKISKEKDCNVVLLRSSKSTIFCRGLNYKEILSDKENVRKNKATELADRVSKFVKCLLDFPKILVAGIQGECTGLAVTMLPLFDIVIGNDNATFSTPYNSLGSIAEAGFLLTVPHIANHGLAGELLYAGQKLTADEAFRRGLISKLCWPEKYQDTVKSTVSSVAKGSRQSLESTKKQLRSVIKESTEKAIDIMQNQLIDHWTSTEFQSNVAKIGD